MGEIIQAEKNTKKTRVEASEESLEQSHSYVLHGAQAYCECGSRLARLTLPVCHGTYMHDMPVMTVEDCQAQINVKAFGFCSSLKNEDRLIAVQNVMSKVEGDKNFLDVMMDGMSAISNVQENIFKKVKSVFGKEEVTDNPAEDPCHGYAPDVYKNVLVPCKPEFAVGDIWMEGTDRLQINGVNALHSGCKLICVKSDGGMIGLADDGQENAAMEQHGSADIENWTEGDPIPDPTQGNLERLDENIEALKKQLSSAGDLDGVRRILEEIDSKTKLRDQMSSTLSMIGEIQTGLVCGAYDETTYQGALEDMGTLREAFKNGTPCVTISEDEQNELLNGAYQTHMDGGDVAAYLSENTGHIPYDSFNGTAVNADNADNLEYIFHNGRLVSRTEYNQSVSDYIDSLVTQNNDEGVGDEG